MSSLDVASLIQSSEVAIREGRGPQVRLALGKLNFAQVEGKLRLPLANLCRRVGLISAALRLLTPQVRQGASAKELAEYAVLLQKIGSLSESLQTLEKIDAEKAPEVLLYTAFYYFSRWEHIKAIPMLTEYLQKPLSDYALLVGRLNLAAANSMSGQWELALELAIECQMQAKAHGHWRLLANCLELKAEIALQSGTQSHPTAFALSRATGWLNEASEILKTHRSFDQLFIWKWRSYVESIEDASISALQNFRALAIERREWESVREADLLALKIAPDAKRLDHLIFGTPCLGYRARIQRVLGEGTTHLLYTWGPGGGVELDVRTGQLGAGAIQSPGKKVHRLIELLARDFYRPTRVGNIFSELYEGQYFDIFSSPGRVYQVVTRARHWLASGAIPLELHESRGYYSLRFTGPIAMVVPLERTEIKGFSVHLNKLKELFPAGHSFSNMQARDRLGLKSSTFKNVMRWAQEEKHLERLGKSSATRYRFAKAS